MVAAKIATMKRGNPTGANQHESGNAPIGATTQDEAGDLLNVGRRSVQRAREVIENGSDELFYLG